MNQTYQKLMGYVIDIQNNISNDYLFDKDVIALFEKHYDDIKQSFPILSQLDVHKFIILRECLSLRNYLG